MQRCTQSWSKDLLCKWNISYSTTFHVHCSLCKLTLAFEIGTALSP